MFSGHAPAEPSRGKLGLFITGLSGDNTFKNYLNGASELLGELLISNGYQREELVKFSDSDEGNDFWNKTEIVRKENLRKFLMEISRQETPFENAFIFIGGHANGRDEEAVLHLPGEDIVYRELMELIDSLPVKRMTVVIAAPQGRAWIQKLSRPGRVIVVGNGYRQYDFIPMLFLRFFPAMFEELAAQTPSNDSSDSSQVSLKDVFVRTQLKVRRWFRENRLRVTELALIDADGDKKGESLFRPEYLRGRIQDREEKKPLSKSAVSRQPSERRFQEEKSLWMDLNLPDAQTADTIIFELPRRNSQHGKSNPSVS